MNRTSDRWRDVWIAVGLFVFGLLSRVPFRSQILYHWDSVNFAFAMREFDVAKEQPHPPGYILYVWLCRGVDLLFGDAQTTMVWISVVASALAVVAFFCLARSMYDRRTGLIAALFLKTSPLFWFYGEIALPHALDTFLVIVSVWWLYKVMQGNHRYLYPAVAVLAIAGGIRQQTIVFLAPLLLFALRHVGWRRFLIAGALGFVICLAWFVPLVTLSGGWSNYLGVMGEFGHRFQISTSVLMGAGWRGIERNVRKLTMYTLYGWSVMLVPGLIHAARRLWSRQWPQHWERSVFLVLWIAPSLIFYAFLHMGQQGLIFVYLPALLLFSAVALARLLVTRVRWLTVAMAVLVALNVGIFCLMPEYPLGAGTRRFLTRATLVNLDGYYQDRFSVIEESFPPASTAILAANWHHVEYYLPAYRLLRIDVTAQEPDAGQANNLHCEEERLSVQSLGLTPDADGRINIVIFDERLVPFNETPELTQAVELDHGGQMETFALSADQVLCLGQTFGVGER